MKKNILIITLLAISAFSVREASAQRLGNNDIFYHSFRSPIATRLNPAAFPTSSHWYITLPSVNAGLSLPVSYKDLGLHYNAGHDTVIFNVNDFLNKLNETGCRFDVNADVDLLGFGFKIGRLSINAAAGLRVAGMFSVPLGVTQLLTEGNLGSNDPVELGCENFLHAQAYGYASLGAAYTLSHIPLTVGARANLLDGLAVLSADDLSMKLATYDDGQSLQVSADYLMHMAGMAYIKETADGKYDLAFDTVSLQNLPIPNWGYTFDLGASYQLGGFNFSASLLDVGPGIHWTNHPATIVPKHQDAAVSFDGVDFSSLLTNGTLDTAFFENLADTLLSMIDYQSSSSDFWAGVPTRLYIGASYSLNHLLRAGYLLHGEWDRGLFNSQSTFRFNNTLSATLNLANWIDLTLANSLTFDGRRADAFNPGVSASLNIGKVMQFYFALDYVSNIYATDIKSARLLVGLNLVGYSKKAQ